jgi:hypothetical protein
MLTLTDQIMTLLSLLALARNFPLWLHAKFHTSSVCCCSIAVVMRGKITPEWSAYRDVMVTLISGNAYLHFGLPTSYVTQ